MDKRRTIRIKGSGQVSMAADTIEISMDLESMDLSYEGSMEKASLALDEIRKTLKEEGFEKKDIKTTNFKVDANYENLQNKNGKYIRKFVGYKVSNRLKIEFDQEPVKLGKVLKSLSFCKAEPEITIRYKLKDQTEMQNKLLENAIKDAKAKADIIAKASGVKLLDIVNIDYSWGELEIYNDSIQYSRSMVLSEASMMDLEPEELTSSDTVTIEWEIE